MKQGLWFEYRLEKILTTDSFRRNPEAVGFHNINGEAKIPIAEGYYKDNRRIGEWKFFKGFYYNDNYAKLTSHEQLVSFTDSGFFRITDTFWRFTARISNDTNNVQGYLFLESDTIKINCINKRCYLNDPFKGKRKRKFHFKELDAELVRLNFLALKVKRGQSVALTGGDRSGVGD